MVTIIHELNSRRLQECSSVHYLLITREDLQNANMPLKWRLQNVCLSVRKKKKDSKNQIFNPQFHWILRIQILPYHNIQINVNNVLVVFILSFRFWNPLMEPWAMHFSKLILSCIPISFSQFYWIPTMCHTLS